MRIDAGCFQICVSEGLRDERDRRALVDGVAGVGVAQPVGGDREIDSGPLCRRLHDVVDAPL